MRAGKLIFCLIMLAFIPLPSTAAEVKLTSSTQYLWYNDILTRDNERDIAEYLRINVLNLDSAKNINVYGYGRVSKQISSDEETKGRLYYLYLDYKNVIKDRLDMKLGRQYVYIPSGSGIIDGASFNFKNFGPVGFTLLGGRDVRFGDKVEITGKGDTMFGASVYANLKDTHLELSYSRKYRESDIARETLGFNFSTNLTKSFSLYGQTKYDVITESTSELLLGVKLYPTDKLLLKAEYYESFPTFDTTSIYSVFAVEKYKEYAGTAQYKLSDNYRLFLKYARENFNDSKNADLYEAGIAAKPVKNLTLNASYEKRNGYAGKLDGFRVNGEYNINKTSISAGVDYDSFDRTDSRSDTAKRYWAGLKQDIKKNISVVARIEDNVNFNYKNEYQGMFALNIKF